MRQLPWAIDILGALLIAVLLVTQIIVPLAYRRSLFPLIRKERRKMNREIKDANDIIDLAELAKDLRQRPTKRRK